MASHLHLLNDGSSAMANGGQWDRRVFGMWSMRASGIALLMCALAGTSVADEIPASPEPPRIDLAATLRAPRADDEAIVRALRKTVDLKFDQTPLKDVLNELQRAAEIPRIRLDKTSLQEEGIADDEPVFRTFKNFTARQALDEICGPLDLAWFIDDGALRVTTRVAADQITVVRLHDAGALRDRILAVMRLRAVLERRPEPTSTDASRAIIAFLTDIDPDDPTLTAEHLFAADRQLIARTTHAEQERIASLLSLLDDFTQGKLEHGHRMPCPDGYPARRDGDIHARLVTKTEVEFVDTPLKDAMEFLDNLHHIHISIDEAALQEEGIATDEPLTYKLRDVPLASALRTILAPLGLVAVVENGLLRITTEVRESTARRTVLYDVRDLVAAGFTERRLADLIRFQARGGPAEGDSEPLVRVAPPGGGLLVIDGSRSHAVIALLLDDLRQKLGPEGLKPGAIDPEGRDQGRRTTKLYHVDRREKVEPLSAAILEFIEPASWKPAGGDGVLRAVGSTLLVSQTAEVHARIEKFIQRLKNFEEQKPQPGRP